GLAGAFGLMRSLKITQSDELQWSAPRPITKRASKNETIDYHVGVLIASLASNLGSKLENTSHRLSAVSIADTSSGERKSYWSGMWRQCTGLSVMRVIASCCSLSAQTISSAHWSS